MFWVEVAPAVGAAKLTGWDDPDPTTAGLSQQYEKIVFIKRNDQGELRVVGAGIVGAQGGNLRLPFNEDSYLHVHYGGHGVNLGLNQPPHGGDDTSVAGRRVRASFLYAEERQQLFEIGRSSAFAQSMERRVFLANNPDGATVRLIREDGTTGNWLKYQEDPNWYYGVPSLSDKLAWEYRNEWGD